MNDVKIEQISTNLTKVIFLKNDLPFFEAFIKGTNTKKINKVISEINLNKFDKPLINNEIISIEKINFKQKVKQLFCKDIWHVGIIDQKIEDIFENSIKKPIKWIPRAKKLHYFADPFSIKFNNQDIVLMEQFDYKTKGWISQYFPNTGEIKTAIKSDFHLSYPFTFIHENKLFALVECTKDRKLPIYEFNELNGKWEFKCNLIKNITAIDATIFNYNGKFWLFFTNENGPNSHLNIFHSDHLFTNWQAHKLNPVKINVCGARPAGRIIKKNGKIYRPAQDSLITYGNKIRIYEITELSEDNFREKQISLINSSDEEFCDGIHTINPHGDNQTIVDAKKLTWPHQF